MLMNGKNSEDETNIYSIKRKSSMYVNVQTYWCFVQLFRSLVLDIRWWWRIGWLSVTWSWLSVLLLSCCVHPFLVDWLNYCANRLLLCKSHLKNYNIIERRDFICAVYVDRSKVESCLFVWYLWHADDAQLLSTAVNHFTSFGSDQLKLKLN